MLASLLTTWSWPELRHHPWRTATALLAVALGVALAFSVHLINSSALSEFSAAVRSINGQPDFELRSQASGFDEALYARVAADRDVAIASPIIELDTRASGPSGKPVAMRLVGIDPLVNGPLAPALFPQPDENAPRLVMLDPDAIFLNASARQQLGLPSGAASPLTLQTGANTVALQVRGTIAAGGAPLAVIDISAAQQHFNWAGKLTRIDVRLTPGASRDAVLQRLQLPPGMRAASPDEAAQRVSNLSRAYRVNLTVLALVALFTGAFLVFSILSLSVAKRQPQLALLGVLGLSARDRLVLVLAESALLGLVGSVIGLALGTALAATALRYLAGDLGGGYFPGVAPQLQFSSIAALVYGALGVVAALIGGWFPARFAQRLAPAQALKGLGSSSQGVRNSWFGPSLIAVGVALSFAPPIAQLPLAAYFSVACLLMGGIACVPGGVAALLAWTRPPQHALAMLAVHRARHQRETATVAVAGVVASLALSVALTVMVGSFRESVTQWLNVVLPADLYVRSGGPSTGTALDPAFVAEAGALPGVARVETLRVVPLQLDAERPSVALIARSVGDATKSLPLVGALVDQATTTPRSPGDAANAGNRSGPLIEVYVSEAMVTLYGASPGTTLRLPITRTDGAPTTAVYVRGVWRDYARQHGAIAIDAADYRRLTGDTQVNDMALWLTPGTSLPAAQARMRTLIDRADRATPLEMSSSAEIRETSLHIFDRSFAVTSYLQTLAIGLGLFGIAASFSAQVLARRKEFGLLAHLGLTRAQVLTVVAAEGAVWTAAGALLGLLLGLAVSVVLVKVVNPQSFNWTMDLLVPWGRLATLCAAVVLAGTVTAWLAGRAAAGRDAALAVKEDW
ncbi:FtsX-like permease family protein [soil metagenome]